jgi:alkane 1-monooxygenase
MPYLLAFAMPLATLSYLVTMPHAWYGALLPVLLIAAFGAFDGISSDAAQPPEKGWAFDVVVVGLAAMQLFNIGVFLLRLRSGAPWDVVVAIVMMGATTGYSAIVVGHELIHRRHPAWRVVGRVLLWTGLYDHFYVEHLRGHHVRLATGVDDAPARLGESFWAFARRSLPGEFVSAWRISPGLTAVGLGAEMASLALILSLLGPAALLAFLLQAGIAGLLITAVNYFQHWGVGRSSKRMSAADAWDCDSVLTHYALLAISRHADHHLHAGRTYPELRPSSASPKLPRGYFRMIALVLFRSDRARELLATELERYQRVVLADRFMRKFSDGGAARRAPQLGAGRQRSQA